MSGSIDSIGSMFVAAILLASPVLSASNLEIDVGQDRSHVKLNGNYGGQGAKRGINVINYMSKQGCCQPEEPFKLDPSIKPWILTVGGKDMYGPVNTVGLASLLPVTHRVPTCLKSIIAPLPKALTGIVGVSLGKGLFPLVCGGSTTNGGVEGICYRYDFKHNEWRAVGRLSKGREFAAASVHPMLGMLITGGKVSDTEFSVTTEYTTDGFEFEELKDLPEDRHMHCQVTMDNGTVLAIGGKLNTGIAQDTFYRYDRRYGRWFDCHLKLPTARWGHACGIVREHGWQKKLVVIGGGNGTYFNDVQILDLKTAEWSQAKPFLHPIIGARTVPFGDTFALTGGSDGTNVKNEIYKYEAGNDNWMKIDNSLRAAVSEHASFSVREDSFPECH